MRSSLFYATAGFSVALAAAGPTVQVLNGTLHGAKCPSTSANYFLSIPYAKPPVRFTAPEPLDTPLSNNFDATQPAPSCIQLGTQLVESGSHRKTGRLTSLPPKETDNILTPNAACSSTSGCRLTRRLVRVACQGLGVRRQ